MYCSLYYILNISSILAESSDMSVNRWCFWAHVLKCSDFPAPPRLVSGSISCEETPKPRFEPFWNFFFICFSLFLSSLSLLLKQLVVSSLSAFSKGIPYVSISHPDRGCVVSAEALPTFGRVFEQKNKHEALILPGPTNSTPSSYGSMSPSCISSAAVSRAVKSLRWVTALRTLLYYSTAAPFEAGRDELVGLRSASLPGYCMRNERGAEPDRIPLEASPAFILKSSSSTAFYSCFDLSTCFERGKKNL